MIYLLYFYFLGALLGLFFARRNVGWGGGISNKSGRGRRG